MYIYAHVYLHISEMNDCNSIRCEKGIRIILLLCGIYTAWEVVVLFKGGSGLVVNVYCEL